MWSEPTSRGCWWQLEVTQAGDFSSSSGENGQGDWCGQERACGFSGAGRGDGRTAGLQEFSRKCWGSHLGTVTLKTQEPGASAKAEGGGL